MNVLPREMKSDGLLAKHNLYILRRNTAADAWSWNRSGSSTTSGPEGRWRGKTLYKLRRSLPLRLGGSHLRPGASRLFPNWVDCLAGGRVRKRVGGCVLQDEAPRTVLPLRVRVQAWDHLPRLQ